LASLSRKKQAMVMENGKKLGLIMKTLDRCRSGRRKPMPEGCFTVYVGEARQRFVIRTEFVNHPLFRTLLEEAEEAFGYAAAGPLTLPCDADEFVRVLEQIEEDKTSGEALAVTSYGLVRSTSYQQLASNRSRLVLIGRS
jgi:SAUR family protein